MKIWSAFSLNIKKLRFRFGKALFLILPIMVLVLLSVVITSQVQNFRTALDRNVFSEIKEEATVLRLEYQADETELQGPQNLASQTQYTVTDVEKIKSITGVTEAEITYKLPITNVSTNDLFSDGKVSFKNINALDSSLAGYYTSRDFTYSTSTGTTTDTNTIINNTVAIPIILNASAFVTTYEDWGDKTEINVEFQRPDFTRSTTTTSTNPISEMLASAPVKSKAISFNKADLIGKEFTMTFGGLKDITDYKVERTDSGTKFTKLTDKEIASAESTRKSTIGAYWNYDNLKKGITYRFVVAGVIDDKSDTSVYVPDSFAKQVMTDYIAYQVENRTAATIANTKLNKTYTGLLYDGTQILSTNDFGGFMRGVDVNVDIDLHVFSTTSGRGRFQRSVPGATATANTTINSNVTSYEIPGLIIKVNKSDSNTVEGIETSSTIFDRSAKTGSVIMAKIDSVTSRESVVKALNKAGYAYQDINDLDVFAKIESTLNQISVGVTIAFIILSAGVIVLTMSKFVSEGKKEIGIFRAVGFTKINILAIYLLQSILYSLVGFGLGIGAGVVLNSVASGLVYGWFNEFVTTTVAQSFNVVGIVDASMFTAIDWSSIGILSLVLAGIVVVISFIPAINASNISPVEAIKSE